ncbi:MAG: hypothetical protein OXH09_15315 [Gammaproteobacteria bacterium]|nr:hypothetical protein [Gammaproteobacteria bacterium]
MSGVATGLRRLDELTGGWHNGELLVIGGRPSMGRTAGMPVRPARGPGPQVPAIYVRMLQIANRPTAAAAGSPFVGSIPAPTVRARRW